MAHGGQVLISDASSSLLRPALPDDVRLRDLGDHVLKDLPAPEHLWQLDIDGLQTDFPPSRSLDATPARLPVEVSSFIGRAEVEAVKALVETTRLVTLTGPGGTGKTRLSIRVAEEIADRFPDGTFFVALDAVTDPELVASEIATSLSLAGGSRPPLERVTAYLRDRAVLLVLDNFEQVIGAATGVGRLLKECPRLTIVATSRIPLRISGEQEFPVPALALPVPGESLDVARAAEFEAIRLFVARAIGARPDFRLTDENVAAVVDIVTRLDGLPLAIELAASRVRSLSVEALRSRLDSRLSMLTGGPRDRHERQRTLRAAIEWSHDLLDEADKRLFARFSVVSGGAVLEQAEMVCGTADELGREIFDGLESLSEQSLVFAPAEAGDDPRFAMLATIREYAAEQLDRSPEADLTRRRHAEAYVALAEAASTHLLGPDGNSWNDRLEQEHDNLRAALDRIVATDASELGLRMVVAVWRFWQVRGHLYEGQERIRAILDLPSVPDQPLVLRGRAEAAAGGVAYWRSDWQSTYRHYQAALTLARESGDKGLLAEALYNAGFAAEPRRMGNIERYVVGRRYFEEGLAIYRELDDRGGIASCLWALSYASGADGDVDGALRFGRQSLELSREIGDPFRTGWATHLVGLMSLAVGAVDDAVPMLEESLGIFRTAGDKSGILLLLLDVALLADMSGRFGRRWCLLGAAERLRVETGSDLVTEEVSIGGRSIRMEPATPDERASFDEGMTLSLADALALASAELAEPR